MQFITFNHWNWTWLMKTSLLGANAVKDAIRLNPSKNSVRSLKVSLALKVNASCALVIKQSYAAGSGAEVKLQNNKKYQTEHKDELAEKMRVRRAKKKVWR